MGTMGWCAQNSVESMETMSRNSVDKLSLILLLRRAQQSEDRSLVPARDSNGVINVSSSKPACRSEYSKRKGDIQRRFGNQKATRVEFHVDASLIFLVWFKLHVNCERCSSIQTREVDTDYISHTLLLQIHRLTASSSLCILNDTQILESILYRTWQHWIEPSHLTAVWIVTIRLIL